MNNNALIAQGLGALNALRSRRKEHSNELARTDYDELRESALQIQNLRERINLLADGTAKDNVRRGLLEAGPVTQAAHLRLSNMREDASGTLGALASRADELGTKASREANKQAKKYRKKLRPFQKKATKTSKRVQKQAEEAAQKVTDRLTGKQAKRRQTLRRVGIGAAIAALLAGLAAVVYTILGRRKAEEEQVLDTPPRVEEESGEEEAKLVYSTETGDTVDSTDAADAADSAEEPAERDEELLDSLDEQLRVNREAHNQTRED